MSHCQGKGSLNHNNRSFHAKNVDSSHTKDNVTFIRQSIGEAYEKLFGAAVERYNARQKRNDRKISCGYYEYQFDHEVCNTVITSADKRKSFYEDVVQIGTKDDTGVGTPDAEIAAKCLTEYMNGFQERNPNFYVFNAVLHMDEATPHLHIDYIPIGHYKRGVDTQNGIAQALKEMGFGDGKDAIARWRQSECDTLKEICSRYGIEISEPEKSRGSMTVEAYKEYKQIEEKLAPLKAIDIVTEKAKIPRKKALLGKNQVIVNEADLDKVEEEKKAVVMQMEIARQAEAKALKKSDDNWRYEAKLNAREAEISENEQYLQTKLRYADQLHTEAYEMYNRQRNINSILEQTERECRQYKSEAERVPYLEHQIEDMEKRLAELEKTCSEKENETAALNERISEQEKENTALRKLYNSAHDIAEYACKKLKIDADRAIQKRSDGYRVSYIFGDEKNRSR